MKKIKKKLPILYDIDNPCCSNVRRKETRSTFHHASIIVHASFIFYHAGFISLVKGNSAVYTIVSENLLRYQKEKKNDLDLNNNEFLRLS